MRAGSERKMQRTVVARRDSQSLSERWGQSSMPCALLACRSVRVSHHACVRTRACAPEMPQPETRPSPSFQWRMNPRPLYPFVAVLSLTDKYLLCHLKSTCLAHPDSRITLSCCLLIWIGSSACRSLSTGMLLLLPAIRSGFRFSPDALFLLLLFFGIILAVCAGAY